jgi:hypothetical protein
MELHLSSRPTGKQASEKKVGKESREVRENSEETAFTTEGTEVTEIRIQTAKKPRRRGKIEKKHKNARVFSSSWLFLRRLNYSSVSVFSVPSVVNVVVVFASGFDTIWP